MKARLLGINKDVLRVRIREYIKPDESRYFTATIHGWNGFKFSSHSGIKSTPLLVNYVIPKVIEIRDQLDGKTLSEQKAIMEELPTNYSF